MVAVPGSILGLAVAYGFGLRAETAVDAARVVIGGGHAGGATVQHDGPAAVLRHAAAGFLLECLE